ncbi:hypothetical protein CaCOL14_004858 [Colletotrichum acutatum]
MATIPRPVFIYVEEVSALVRSAKVENVARYSLHGCDYLAAIREHGSSINGLLIQPQSLSQRKKLDDFEGEVYQTNLVQAMVLSYGGETVESLIEADIYLWNGDKDLVLISLGTWNGSYKKDWRTGLSFLREWRWWGMVTIEA